ncbi:MAG: hypothetical protein HC878_20060 [Leptolyngbyaceae cyanobacterium SL_5_14]|nr:hypothetical protein [Leptolyngbyaceae cyanobacterium SL_5_14]
MAETYDEFVKVLYIDIDRIIYQLEENPELRRNDNEDRLTIDIENQLRCMGYNASHDSKVGGHTDLSVRKGSFLWIGEAKIHKSSYDYLWEGFQQLSTRYSTGDSNQRDGGILIYIRCKDTASILKRWQDYLREKNLPDYSCEPCKIRSLSFFSTHKHERSGQAFQIRHMPVILHFDPKDKSGRTSKSS